MNDKLFGAVVATCAFSLTVYIIRMRKAQAEAESCAAPKIPTKKRMAKKFSRSRRSSSGSNDDCSELKLIQDIVFNTVEPAKLNAMKRKYTMDVEGHPILIVGVCGGSGSGKTTLSKSIIKRFGKDKVTYLSHDYYYKDLGDMSLEERAQHNFDHPDSLETDLMVEHVRELRAGKSVNIPTYDFATHKRNFETMPIVPKQVILVEGILLFTDQSLVDLMDIKIFVETAADIRFIRRLRRDMVERHRTADSVMEQYMKTVRPMHRLFVEPSKRVADIIIPHGVNEVALDMIISRLDSFTEKNSVQ